MCGTLRMIVDRLIIHHADFTQTVREHESQMTISYRMQIGDKGRLIGREGKVYRSLSTLARLTGRKLGKIVDLLPYDDADFGIKDRYPPASRKTEAPLEEWRDMLRIVLNGIMEYPALIEFSCECNESASIIAHVSDREPPDIVRSASEAVAILFKQVALRSDWLLVVSIEPDQGRRET